VGKRISLSEAGRVVLKGGEEILGRVGEMRRELDELSGLRAGTLAIGASQVIGVYLVPRLIAAFRAAYPGIELSVAIEPARRIAELLASNEVDVALVGEGTPFNDERIAMKPVLRDELILIVPVSHIFAQMRSVKLASLTEMPFIFPHRGSASSESVLEQLAGRGIRPNSVLELGNIGAVKRAVEAGMGVSIVSRMAVQRELADGRLKSVPIAGLKLERQVSLCWHHHRPFSKVTEAFIAFVTREAGALLAGP
jgi:DNA-binding transcriptional LysR family regulator